MGRAYRPILLVAFQTYTGDVAPLFGDIVDCAGMGQYLPCSLVCGSAGFTGIGFAKIQESVNGATGWTDCVGGKYPTTIATNQAVTRTIRRTKRYLRFTFDPPPLTNPEVGLVGVTP